MNKAEQRRELWRQKIAEQEISGQTIRAYCLEHGLKEHALYRWRQRLREQNTPVHFALVEKRATTETAPPIELMLSSGERLRIPSNAATLKLVLAVLREPA